MSNISVDYDVLNQRGSPAWFTDTFANIPTAGFVGRMFISTDTFAFYRDTGTGWDLIGGPGTGTITGSGVTGQVSFFNGTQVLAGNNNLFWDNTNSRLGINTTTPGQPLDIHSTGNTLIQLNNTTTANSNISFQNQNVAKWRVGNVYNGGANSFDIQNAGLSTNAISINSTTNNVDFGSTIGNGTFTYTLPSATGTLALTSNIPTNPVGGTGTTNTLPKFTAASTIGNSNITDSSSLITLGSNTTISSGSLGIGTTSLTQYSLRVSKTITGATTSYGIQNDGVIQSGVTSIAAYNSTSASTVAAAFTCGTIYHYLAVQGTFGASSTVTNQFGFIVGSSLIGATNNFGFRGDIPSGTNRWNLYMNGTAANYMAGVLNIGTTTLSGFSLDVNGTARISGVLTLSSTISNGTYTYTLPSATGTLALTSNITSAISGTTNRLAKFTSTNVIGNSMVSDDGTTLTSAGATRSNLYIKAVDNTYYSQLAFTNGTNASTGGLSYNNAGQYMQFETSTSEWMRLTSDGKLGIGLTTISYQLQLSTDSAAKPTTSLWTIASDKRIKENINPYKKGLQELLKINPITYDYNGLGGFKKGKGGVGIIAQEIIDILPDSVSSIKAKLNETDKEETDILNFNGHELTYVLINAIKEINEKLVKNNIN